MWGMSCAGRGGGLWEQMVEVERREMETEPK
jgi:hypothetical protein